MTLYLRPTAFIDAPFGIDGHCARLAGGLTWFSAVEVITRTHKQLVPVDRIDAFRAALPDRARFDWLWQNLTAPRPPLVLGTRTLRFDVPAVMGILNLTPDSFSGGGILDAGEAAAKALDMAAAGAAIIDIGAESTRPGAKLVWEQDEIARLMPVLERLRGADLPISADTRKAAVMRAAISGGARLINDVSGLTWDDRALSVVAEAVGTAERTATLETALTEMQKLNEENNVLAAELQHRVRNNLQLVYGMLIRQIGLAKEEGKEGIRSFLEKRKPA